MNILFVVPYTPTLIRTRPYNFIRALVRRGHSITLATLWETDDERLALSEWAKIGVKVVSARLGKPRSLVNTLLALPTRTPLQVVYCWQPALAKQIKMLLQSARFDAIHVEHLRGVKYGLFIGQLPKHPPVVWDSVDCISYLFAQAARQSGSLFGRWVTRLELGRTQHYESWLPNRFEHVLITSPMDKLAIEQLIAKYQPATQIAQSERITVVPNGVDLEYFQPCRRPAEARRIVISGKMSYHANVTAALHLVNDIMPLVWAKRPEAQVVIVGKNPSREVLALGQRYAPRVLITGTVPDIRPHLAEAVVAVSPVKYGAGIQNKVLEAMAMGVPVVATSQAVSALQAHADEHLLVADTTEAFSNSILRLLDTPLMREQIGIAGRRYVEEQHDWNKIAGRLEELYRTANGSQVN